MLYVVGGGGRLCLTINTYHFCPWRPDLFLVGWSTLLSACLKHQHSSHEPCLIEQLNVKMNSFRGLCMKELAGRSEHMSFSLGQNYKEKIRGRKNRVSSGMLPFY